MEDFPSGQYREGYLGGGTEDGSWNSSEQTPPQFYFHGVLMESLPSCKY